MVGLACGNYHTWPARIKAEPDPHGASGPFFQAEAEKGGRGETYYPL
jgi:hypothetical protein